MKTLIVTLEYPPQVGGIASYVYNFAKNQPADSVVVVAPETPGAAEFDAAHPWKTIRVKPYFLLIWPRWMRLLFIVRRLVRQEGVDQLHVHHVLPVGYIAYLLKRWKKISNYTVFLHGTDVVMATKQQRKRAWFQKICAQAARLVTNSAFLQRKIGEFTTTPIHIVHPCPGEHFLQPVPEQTLTSLRAHLALSGKKVVLTVGRMVEGKGFPHCIRLLPQILAIQPNTVWIMVGNGPKRNDIISLVQKNNLQNAVRFLGELSSEQLPAIYALADVFVLLSHPDNGVEEGWGTVFMEAAAAGLPVVAGRSGGVEEAVIDGLTGRVVDVYQASQVVETIVHMLSHPDEAKAMGRAGRDRAEREFIWKKQLAKL